MIGTSAARDKSAAGDGNVVLNLSGVPLQQAAKTVLGDMIGVNYVVDPRVDGVISVQTNASGKQIRSYRALSDCVGSYRSGARAEQGYLQDCSG